MFIPDPGFYPSRIQKRNKREGWKKGATTYFCSHKYHKIENYFIFEQVKNKIWANLQRILELFTQKLSLSF